MEAGPGANNKDKNNKDGCDSIVVDLYIGVFFDGTNNNKYQVMLGKMFRRKEILDNAKSRTKFPDEIPDVNTLLTMSRDYVEKKYKGVFTRSELDHLYFGYEEHVDNDDKLNCYYRGIEEKSRRTLSKEPANERTSAPGNQVERDDLIEVAAKMGVGEISNTRIKNYKGAAAQVDTYTNVAILESLYKCGDKKNGKGEITERHISIYVEGSGADMQIAASPNKSHKLGYQLYGLSVGTGTTGVEAKTRKAAWIVNDILNKYKGTSRVKVKLHFDICGFSRGATSARMFCYIVNSDPKNNKTFSDGISILDIERKNTIFVRFSGRKDEFLKLDEFLKEKEIRNLLIADTVSSIGVLDEGMIKSNLKKNIISGIAIAASTLESARYELPTPFEEHGHWHFDDEKIDEGTKVSTDGLTTYHHKNVDAYGLWATSLSKNTVHICALDEYRKNFALVDIESSITAGTGTEIFIPGCHTDIGGGAAIGQEDSYIVSKVPKRRFLLSHGQKEEDLLSDNLIEISSESLKRLGWLPKHSKPIPEEFKEPDGRVKDTFLWQYDNTIYTENEASTASDVAALGNALALRADVVAVAIYLYKKRWDNIIMYRHVKPGYSNLSLKVLREKANAAPFNPIPYAYRIPLELNDFYKRIIGTEKGRHFFFPNEKDYQRLRSEYLHFSFDEQWKKTVKGGGVLVNAPEFTAKDNFEVLSRIIYKGEKDCNTEKRFHLFDYNEDADDVQVFGDKKNEINVKNIPEMTTMVNHDGILIDDRELPRKYDKSNDHLFI